MTELRLPLWEKKQDAVIQIDDQKLTVAFSELNYSLQNPQLPDWAVVDLSQLPNDQSPGKIVAADFFDEQWKFKAGKN